MRKKRSLFDELREGFDALSQNSGESKPSANPKVAVKTIVRLDDCPAGVFESFTRGIKIKGTLEIEHNKHVMKLPEDLRVSQNLTIMRCNNIKEVPSDLRVGGDFAQFPWCGRLKEIHKGAFFAKHLVLCGSSIKMLPERIEIHGDLHVQDCEFLMDLPEKIKANRILYDNFTGFAQEESKLAELKQRFKDKLKYSIIGEERE